MNDEDDACRHTTTHGRTDARATSDDDDDDDEDDDDDDGTNIHHGQDDEDVGKEIARGCGGDVRRDARGARGYEV